MADNKIHPAQSFKRGLISENPVLRLCLGTCPTLAISTTLAGSLGMGIAATLVLIGSNIVISALRKAIPDKVRIPSYIVIIASFVTIIQLLVKAYLPSIDKALGIYLPLIVVNCVILGRAEAYANKNTVPAAALDGLTMGIGFTAAISLMAIIREILGSGTLLGGRILPAGFPPITILILPPGGFFVFGLLVALANRLATAHGKEPMQLNRCAGCPSAEICAQLDAPEAAAESEVAQDTPVKERLGRDPESIAYDHAAVQASQYDSVKSTKVADRRMDTDRPESSIGTIEKTPSVEDGQNDPEVKS